MRQRGWRRYRGWRRLRRQPGLAVGFNLLGRSEIRLRRFGVGFGAGYLTLMTFRESLVHAFTLALDWAIACQSAQARHDRAREEAQCRFRSGRLAGRADGNVIHRAVLELAVDRSDAQRKDGHIREDPDEPEGILWLVEEECPDLTGNTRQDDLRRIVLIRRKSKPIAVNVSPLVSWTRKSSLPSAVRHVVTQRVEFSMRFAEGVVSNDVGGRSARHSGSGQK